MLFWLRKESLGDSANLGESAVIAAEIVQDFRATPEELAAIEEDLG